MVRSPYIELAASGLPNPTRLEGEGAGTIYPGSRPAGVTSRSPRMVTECLLTRSMLIKVYLPLHGMCRICTLYLQSVNSMQMLTQ